MNILAVNLTLLSSLNNLVVLNLLADSSNSTIKLEGCHLRFRNYLLKSEATRD